MIPRVAELLDAEMPGLEAAGQPRHGQGPRRGLGRAVVGGAEVQRQHGGLGKLEERGERALGVRRGVLPEARELIRAELRFQAPRDDVLLHVRERKPGKVEAARLPAVRPDEFLPGPAQVSRGVGHARVQRFQVPRDALDKPGPREEADVFVATVFYIFILRR